MLYGVCDINFAAVNRHLFEALIQKLSRSPIIIIATLSRFAARPASSSPKTA
jgi:hypothetical protein